MKILQVHNEYREPGGEEKVVNAEAKLLRDHGDALVSYRFKSGDIKGVLAKIQTAWNLPYSDESKRTISKLIRQEKPDIMHVHNFFPLATPSIFEAAKDAGIPTVLTLHNYRILCANGLLLREGKPCELCVGGSPWQAVKYSCYQGSRLNSLAMARMIAHHQKAGTWHKAVDKFIVLTEFAKSRYVSAGLPAEKFVVKPNFIFDPLKGAAAEEIPFQQKPKLVYVGRLSNEKGVHTLLDAKKLSDQYELHIIGDGQLREDVQAAAAQDSQIIWHGFKGPEFIYSAIANSYGLIFPSECYENFPITLLEAMAMGRPSFVSRIGGLAEIISHKDNGFFFQSGNAADLNKAIDEAFMDKPGLGRVGRAAREKFLQLYTSEKNYLQLNKIYESLI